jgi:CRISPR-associated protein (TIGR03985 family)
MHFPTIALLENLVPELANLAHCHKSHPKQIANFSALMHNAARLWTIERSLYDSDSDFFVEIEEEWFECVTWINKLKDKIPELEHKSLAYFLLGDRTELHRKQWKEDITRRYKIERDILDNILSLPLFKVSARTLRNNFKRLSSLKKSETERGKYQKIANSLPDKLSNLMAGNFDRFTTVNNELLEFFNDGISTIAELLLTKLNGTQRFFIQADYIASEELQDIVGDWSDNLKEVWKEEVVCPIKIKYLSASKNKISSYIIYPVSIHYYQRAYYLYAFGETPERHNKLSPKNLSLPFGWYSYRLERILNLGKLSWDDSPIAQSLKSEIYSGDRVNYPYTPEYIHEQLELAYGFSFYREAKTMLLRFEPDYECRYIKNTVRHQTFEKVEDVKEVKYLLLEQIKIETDPVLKERQKQLLDKVMLNPEDAYYKLRYRVGDNDVIMRLRSWGHNVEVISPWDLRSQIQEELEKTCNLYQ